MQSLQTLSHVQRGNHHCIWSWIMPCQETPSLTSAQGLLCSWSFWTNKKHVQRHIWWFQGDHTYNFFQALHLPQKDTFDDHTHTVTRNVSSTVLHYNKQRSLTRSFRVRIVYLRTRWTGTPQSAAGLMIDAETSYKPKDVRLQFSKHTGRTRTCFLPKWLVSSCRTSCHGNPWTFSCITMSGRPCLMDFSINSRYGIVGPLVPRQDPKRE